MIDLLGKTVVFTGNPGCPNARAKVALECKGAVVRNGVSNKVDFLITAHKPGPATVQKAGALGIPVIHWSELNLADTAAELEGFIQEVVTR